MSPKYKPIKFPEDESIHDCTGEWWYWNGHLKDGDGNRYSFMNCLFRVDVKKADFPLLSRIPVKTAYFSHSLLSDLARRSFTHRISPFSLISEDSFSKPRLFINYLNPTIKNKYNNCEMEKTGESEYHVKNEDIDLQLTLVKRPILEGGKGFIELPPKATYYYSLPNLKTEGRIKIKNKWIAVTGKSWMDHQWGNLKYSKDKWDWFSIQLDNDTELICFKYDNGKTKMHFADISYANGHQEHHTKVEIIPLKQCWKSPRSQATYPLAWKIIIPEKNIDLDLTAIMKKQEMLFTTINYWEGPFKVSGSFGDKKVGGFGFMELVGYPSEYTNTSYLKDEITQAAKSFFSVTKKIIFG
jgi:predicted secreted hydrolase